MDERCTIVLVALALCVFDVLTGYAAAVKNGTLNSSVMSEGLWNKLGEVFAIIIAFVCEFCISLYGTNFIHVSLDVPISTGVCAYITLYELTSIIENIGKMNSTIGKWLINVLGIDPIKVGLSGEVNKDAD